MKAGARNLRQASVALPPSNVEAEAAFLGRALSDPVFLDQVSPSLRAEDFFEPAHARIYECVLDARARNVVPSPVSLAPILRGEETLQKLNGAGYLARLTGNLEGFLVPDGFAGQIAELALRRRTLAWFNAQAEVFNDVEQPMVPLEVPADLAPPANPLAVLDLIALADIEPEPKHFIIPRLAPAAEVTLFTGAGAVGKSLLAQQLATAIAAGTSMLGLDLTAAPAIYITCEDDAKVLHFREFHICRALGVNMADLKGRLHLISLRGELDNALASFDYDGRLTPAPLFARISQLVRETKAALLCLDNVAHLFSGNENDRGNVTQFVNLLNRLAGETGVAILLMGHPNKGGDTYSGSTGWLNAVRSQIFMSRLDEESGDPDTRTVSVGKPNYTQAGEALRFRWHNWAFVLEKDLPADTRKEIAEVIRANSENGAFLACLRARAEQGDARAVGPAPGPNYAPSQFEGMPQAKGFKSPSFKRAMNRLYDNGVIRHETVFNPKAKRSKTILVEVEEPPHNSHNAPHNSTAQPRTTRST